MKAAFIIFIAMVVIGVVLYLIDLFYYRRKKGYLPLSEERAIKQQAEKDSKTVKSAAFSGGAAAGETGGRVAEDKDSVSGSEASSGKETEGCCGMHIVCEKTNLSPISAEVIYYDDEELDRFRGRDPKSYTPEETEEFRDVLMTLLPEDVAGWSRSIQLREIALPTDVRDELLLIVSELRQAN